MLRTRARAALRLAVDAPRADRRIAESARDAAEDALAAAQDRLREAIAADGDGEERGPGDPTDAQPADIAVGSAAPPSTTTPALPADGSGWAVASDRVNPTRSADAPGAAPADDDRGGSRAEASAADPVADELPPVEVSSLVIDAADDPAVKPAAAAASNTPDEPSVAVGMEDHEPDRTTDDAAVEPGARGGVGRWNAWIATALAADRAGLAFHVATARDLAGGGSADDVPAAVLEALVRGRATRAAYDGDWRRYEDGREQLMALASGEDPSAMGQAVVLLIVAGALRPALLQSQAALDVLNAISGDIAARLNPLVRMLTDMRHANLQSLQEIAAPAGEEARRERIAATRDALEQWQRDAPRRGPGFQRGAVVWQNLTAPLGRIGSVVDAVLSGAADAGNAARALVSRLSDRAQAEQIVLDADDSRSGKSNPVQGPAMRHLINLCGDVAERLQDWLLAQALPAAGDDRLGARRKQLLAGLRAAHDVAIAAAEGGAPLAAAAGIFSAVVDQLRLNVEGGGGERAWTLDDELALLPLFPLNARVDVRIDADDALDLERAAGALDAGVPSVDDAFEAALTAKNASAARRLIAFLPAGRRTAGAADLDRAVAAARVTVKGRARALRQRLDDLQIALDGDDRLPDEIERDMSGFEQKIEQGTLDALPLDSGDRGDLADFPAAARLLDSIETRLTAARAPVETRLCRQVERLEARLGVALEEPRALLDKGDLGTLAEQVSQIGAHGLSPTRSVASVDLLRRFMRVVDALGDRPSLDLVMLQRDARDGRTTPPFDFARLAPADRGRAAQMLGGALGLRRAAAPGFKGDFTPAFRTALGELLTALGFTGVRVEQVRRDGSLLRADVTTDPLRDRQYCLVPAFGSGANGRYAFVIAPEGQAASLRTQFDKLPQDVIVLSVDPLIPRLRRELQRQARSGTRSVAVVDMVTLATLAAEPDAGTRAFFDLALPFGAAHPYSAVSRQTSLEMFFGREREYKQLVDPQGACLVYGGRQLGKTALLKQAELKENVGDDRIAIYCDLDMRKIGETLPPSAVWGEIEEKLLQNKVRLADGDSVADRLKTWVKGAPGRYMLILLDEADAFLEAEMAGTFEEVSRMRALMDDTKRAIKFVFAGLHNVQRFHRAPNSPLLHFGTSINVGPLLGSDREAARQMALEPMAALGIAFDDPLDASHMLSLVGFYPSLVQCFGKALVEQIDAGLQLPHTTATMPVVLDRARIGTCFNDQDFRKEVIKRFKGTLDLDERYELITYAVWQRAMQDDLQGRQSGRGYPGSVIRDMADYWWPTGFGDTDSPDSFAALLDEMVGMGVLNRDGERYALRSRRIMAMLGSKEEIENELDLFRHRRPKRRADPMTSHRRMAGGIWSPLSLRQEAVMRDRLSREADPVSVMVLGGSPATGGGDDLFAAVTTLAGSLDWPEPRGLSAQPADVVLTVARAVRGEAHRNRPKLIVVRNAWPSVADLAALRRDRLLRDPAHPVRVVYQGAPTPAILALDDGADWLRMLLGPLPVDAIVHWMNREALPFASRDGVAPRLRRATGGFLQALDAIRLPVSERGDPERLIARAEATTLDRGDLGLDAELAAFAAALGNLIGDQPEASRELERWAADEAPAEGAARLVMLRALGVLEPAPDGTEQLNPAAYRALA